MDSNLKKMFEDASCSTEEREMLAALQGKTVNECHEEWKLAYLIGFASDIRNMPRIQQNTTADGNTELFVLCRPMGLNQHTIDCLIACNAKIGWEENTTNNYNHYQFHQLPTLYEVSFSIQGLSIDKLVEIENNVRNSWQKALDIGRFTV